MNSIKRASEDNENSGDAILLETIGAVEDLLKHMINLCQNMAKAMGNVAYFKSLKRLTNELALLSESIGTLKGYCKIANDPRLQVLEVDLASIIQDLLSARQKGNLDYERELIEKYLVENFEEWRKAIPIVFKK